MIQIRNVPDKVHKALKIRAIEAGMSLSEYLLKEVTAMAEKPSKQEIMEMIRSLPRLESSESSAEIIRQAREERGEQLWPSTINDKS